jgi:hypothetical protein
MKPAAKLNSKQCAIVFVMALGLTACVLLLFVVTSASAQSSGQRRAKPTAPARSYAGVVASQTTNWGIYKVKACGNGIRIETQNQAIVVATPPDWTVYIFRNGQKRAAKITYAMFRTKNLRAIKLSQIRLKPKTKRVVGVNAIEYDFQINQPLEDTTMGGLYRSRESKPMVVTKEVVFAPNLDMIPKQAKGIWSNFFEIPVFEEIPMQTILHLSNGETRAYFDTKSFSRATMTAGDFAVPSGLSYTSQFAEMIYGKEMEGVVDLLPDP